MTIRFSQIMEQIRKIMFMSIEEQLISMFRLGEADILFTSCRILEYSEKFSNLAANTLPLKDRQ